MRVARLWLPLIASCFMATGCSLILLGYDSVPSLVKYQVTRYFDLSTQQDELVEARLAEAFDWHRKTQLPEYASFLNQVQDKVRSNSTIVTSDIERWRLTVQGAWTPTANRLAKSMSEISVSLSPRQMERYQKKTAESNKKMLNDYVKSGGVARQKARADRLRKRAEFFFDSLTAEQKALIVKRSEEAPDSEEAWYRERIIRQQNFIALVEQIRSKKLDAAQAEPLVRNYLVGMFEPKDPKNASLIRESSRSGDETTAALFAIATPEQKEFMLNKIASFSKDFERLSKKASSL